MTEALPGSLVKPITGNVTDPITGNVTEAFEQAIQEAWCSNNKKRKSSDTTNISRTKQRRHKRGGNYGKVTLGKLDFIFEGHLLRRSNDYYAISNPSFLVGVDGREHMGAISKKLKDEGYTLVDAKNLQDRTGKNFKMTDLNGFMYILEKCLMKLKRANMLPNANTLLTRWNSVRKQWPELRTFTVTEMDMFIQNAIK